MRFIFTLAALFAIATPVLAQTTNGCPAETQRPPQLVQAGRTFAIEFDAEYPSGVSFQLRINGSGVQTFLSLASTPHATAANCWTYRVDVPASFAIRGQHTATIRAFFGDDHATALFTESAPMTFVVLPTPPVNLRVSTRLQAGGAVEMQVFVDGNAAPLYSGKVDLATVLAAAAIR